MSSNQLAVGLTAAALTFSLAAGVWADSHIRMVRVTYLAHGVATLAPAAQSWVLAVRNAPVVEREALRTEAGGEAEVQFECGSFVRLIPSSRVAFSRLALADNGVPETTITVGEGAAFFTLQPADSRDFHVRAGDGDITPAGSGSFRVDFAGPDGAASRVAVLAGRVTVTLAGRSFALKKSQQFAWNATAPVRTARADSWTKWSQQRDRVFTSALAAAQPRTGMEVPGTDAPSPLARVAGAPPADSGASAATPSQNDLAMRSISSGDTTMSEMMKSLHEPPGADFEAGLGGPGDQVFQRLNPAFPAAPAVSCVGH